MDLYVFLKTGFSEWTHKYKILEWVNDGFTNLLGFTKNEFIERNGKNLCEISKNTNN